MNKAVYTSPLSDHRSEDKAKQLKSYVPRQLNLDILKTAYSWTLMNSQHRDAENCSDMLTEQPTAKEGGRYIQSLQHFKDSTGSCALWECRNSQNILSWGKTNLQFARNIAYAQEKVTLMGWEKRDFLLTSQSHVVNTPAVSPFSLLQKLVIVSF